jgi:Minichromosome loss protein, Mcl1, middle region
MLLKKFSTSHHKFEELELEDQGEELYAISVGKAKSSGVEYNLTFAGETGKVLNIHLDSSLSFTGKTK